MARSDFTLSEEEAAAARDIGIYLLEVDDLPPLQNIHELGFFYLLQLPLMYNTPRQFTDRERVTGSVFRHYENSGVPTDRIAAVSLFRYPDDRSEIFYSTVSAMADTLSDQMNKPLYYQSAFRQIRDAPEGLAFVSVKYATGDDLPEPSHPAAYFQPGGQPSASLQSLEQILNRFAGMDESILILPADWFFERLKAQPELALLFTEHLRGETITFPLPAEETPVPNANWPVIFLFLIWGSFVVLYRYQPAYPSMILRHLTNHSFFVADVMENRIRSGTSATVLLVQHCIMAGVLGFVMAHYFLSPNGATALAHAFPYLMIFPSVEFSLLLAAIFLGLVMHLISLASIYFSNKSIANPAQVINLYAWPLALNACVLTLLIFLVQIKAGPLGVCLAALLFLFIWFMSFNMAAIDAARYLDKFRILNLFLTIGLNVIILFAGILLLIFLPSVFEPLRLAISIP